ncbi:hypothetical protein BG004_007213 [Podila humilis]|nr:hypothetical protein BG004_007213 [Podila humilis]
MTQTYPSDSARPGSSTADHSEAETEDNYDFDDALQSSDSELVFHPSDSEDLDHHPRSHSPSSSASARPSLDTLRHLHHPFSTHHGNASDDFLLVGSEDASRPHSSLSLHSDQDRHDNPMHLVYPSMVLVPPRKPSLNDNDTLVPNVVTDESLESLAHNVPVCDVLPETSLQQNDQEVPLGSPISLTAVVPVPSIDSSIETVTDLGTHSSRTTPAALDTLAATKGPHSIQPSTTVAETISETHNPTSPKVTKNADNVKDVEHLADSAAPSPLSKPVVHPAQAHPIRITAVPKAPQSHARSDRGISQKLVFQSLILVLGTLLTGMLTRIYFAPNSPMQLVVNHIDYVQDHRVAVVHVDLLTHNGKPFASRKPYNLQARVLDVAEPLAIENAPTQALHNFAEPIVHDQKNGSCAIYITSIHRLARSHGLPVDVSPWLCHRTPHYLHMWFANGTRVPTTPREIFTNAAQDTEHPWACKAQKLLLGLKDEAMVNNDGKVIDEDDEYLAYVVHQYRLVTDRMSKGLEHHALTWDRARATANEALIHIRQSLDSMSARALEWFNGWYNVWHSKWISHTQSSQSRAARRLDRARVNAKKIQKRAVNRMQDTYQQLIRSVHEYNDQVLGTATAATLEFESDIGRRLQTLKKQATEQMDHLRTNQVVKAAEDMLEDTTEKLESRLKAAFESEKMQKIANKLDKDAAAVADLSERLLTETAKLMDDLKNMKQVQSMKGKLKDRTDKFKTTATGRKLVKEANAIQKDFKKALKQIERRLEQRLYQY